MRLGRRDVITLLGGAAAAWPLSGRAQQPRVKRVAVLQPVDESNPDGQARLILLRGALQKLVWVEGRNLQIDAQWTGADPQRMRTVAADTIRQTPDVIVTLTNQMTGFVGGQTHTIPIIFMGAGDAVGTGLVANMAHPGGNVTGFTTYESQIAGKKIELLKQVVPTLARVAVLYTPGGAASQSQAHLIESVAPSLHLTTVAIGARDGEAMEREIQTFVQQPHGGLAVLTGAAVISNRRRIIALAARHRLPAVYSGREYVAEGGLMSYATSTTALAQGAASYVDRVLKGEKPGDMPVQLATSYELVISLKTATALGLTVPPTLLALADDVIE